MMNDYETSMRVYRTYLGMACITLCFLATLALFGYLSGQHREKCAQCMEAAAKTEACGNLQSCDVGQYLPCVQACW